MKNKLFLICLLIYSNFSIAQENIIDESKVQSILEKDFNKLQNIDIKYLIPYYENKKCGLIDRNKKVILPAKYYSLKLAKPNISGYFNKRFAFTYLVKTGEIKVRDTRNPKEDLSGSPSSPEVAFEPETPRRISSSNGFKGFQMDEQNQLIAYSDIYNSSSVPTFNVSIPFSIDDKFYAVARKKIGCGIIDEEGNTLEGFDFNYKILVPLAKYRSYRDSVMWFYFEDNEGNTGFINKSGEQKMYKELLRYPLTSHNYFGYNIQASRGEHEMFGVLDLVKLEWLIKPQSQKIMKIDYATDLEDVDKFSIDARNQVILFYYNYDRKTKDKYYLSKALDIMKPEK